MPVKVTTPPLNVHYNSKGAALASRANYARMEVRAYENVGVKRVWIEDRVGVPCKIRSPYFSVDLKTPAAVSMPVFGSETPLAVLTCVYDGETLSANVYASSVSGEGYQYSEQSMIFKR